MNEKISRLAKGDFDYDQPEIILSEELIDLSIEHGMIFRGSFSVKNSKKTKFKGYVYSTDSRVKIVNPQFEGEINTIRYEVHGEYIVPGKRIDGEISIITNCGEYIMYFDIKVFPLMSKSSIGPIKDLFLFTDLARVNLEEAAEMFLSPNFEDKFLKNNSRLISIHRGLVSSADPRQALEEFLIAAKKKDPITISASANELVFDVTKTPVSKTVKLFLSGWGYGKIKIKCNGEFLSIEETELTTTDFINGEYDLVVTANKELLHKGKQFAKIEIGFPWQTCVIDTIVSYRASDASAGQRGHDLRQYEINMLEDYIKFQSQELSGVLYKSNALSMVESFISLCEKDNRDFTKISQSRRALSLKRKKIANAYKQFLLIYFSREDGNVQFNSIVSSISDQHGIINAANSFLRILSSNGGKENDRAYVSTVEMESMHNPKDARILSMFLLLEPPFLKNLPRRLSVLQDAFIHGCRSPLLYQEAIKILNEDTTLVYEDSRFILQTINFGIKHHLIKRETANTFAEMCSAERTSSKLVFRVLKRLLDEFGGKEITVSVMNYLINLEDISEKNNKYYRMAIREQIKSPKLFDNFLMSVPKEGSGKFDLSVFEYYRTNRRIPKGKEAILYAKILQSKSIIPNTYKLYKSKIEYFAISELQSGSFDANLAAIYKDVLGELRMTKAIADAMANICGKFEFSCKNDNIIKVSVIHKETKDEIVYDLIEGKTYIDIFSDDYAIVLIDKEDNRYCKSIDYSIKEMFPMDAYLDMRFGVGSVEKKLMIRLFEKVQKYDHELRNVLAMQKEALELSGISERFKADALLILINHFYDNYDGDLLEIYLSMADLTYFDIETRGYLMNLILVRDMNDLAGKMIEKFGFEGIDVKMLFRYCAHMIDSLSTVEFENEPDEDLLNLCAHVFENGQYNAKIVEYLVKHFSGTTEQMYELWCAGEKKENIIGLEEKLLKQMLFSESYLIDSATVFESYYNHRVDDNLIDAYLNYTAYKYLVNDREPEEQILSIMQTRISEYSIRFSNGTFSEEDFEKMLSNINMYKLAILKNASKLEVIPEGRMPLINLCLSEYTKKGIVFPFFLNFKGKVEVPESILSKHVIDYYGKPDSIVRITYLDKNGVFVTEEMKSVFKGIFVKEIVLFYGETFRYYITEEDKDGNIVLAESTEERLFDFNEFMFEDSFSQFNGILIAESLHDRLSVLDDLVCYLEKYTDRHIDKKEFTNLLETGRVDRYNSKIKEIIEEIKDSYRLNAC